MSLAVVRESQAARADDLIARAEFTSALTAALAELDALLAVALERTECEFTPQGALDGLRGLHISRDEVRRALGGPRAGLAADGDAVKRIALTLSSAPRFDWLIRTHDLDAFETVAFLIALAPEIDLRYQRIYAYLQDDVTKRRPTVDLILNLLCAHSLERLERRGAFSAEGALVRHELVDLVADPNYVKPPLLARYVVPDEQLARFLAGDDGLDSRLADVARLVEPRVRMEDLPVSDATRAALHAHIQREPGCLWLHGPQGVKKGETAESIAFALGRALVTCDARRIDGARIERTVRLAIRDAQLRDAVLFLRCSDAVLQESHIVDSLLESARTAACTIVIGSTQAPPARARGAVAAIELPLPDAAVRAMRWRQTMQRHSIALDESLAQSLGSRFALTPAQIDVAVATAARTSHSPAAAELSAAARAQSGDVLAQIADRIEPRAAWDDLVLPPEATTQLRELCARVEHRVRVMDDWGFARKLSRGRGTAALFSGGSGTGKTMAAEVIANALGLDLYRIDLARVVNKYIGETEKNLARVFEAAEGANAILFFDEADALFGKRSEVKDAHDRYANIEISYLLQRMEEYEGLAILATNLVNNFDDAFKRRLAFVVHFPFPDEEHRQRLWTRVWPEATPLSAEVDAHALAKQMKMSGGNVRNVALAAAFMAAEEDGPVTAAHVQRAAYREYQKLGKAQSPVERMVSAAQPDKGVATR